MQRGGVLNREDDPSRAMCSLRVSWEQPTQQFNTTLLPIHMACTARAPLAVIECLLKASPKCIFANELCYGCIPLHLHGMELRNSTGRTPIFYLTTRDTAINIYKCLQDAYPDAINNSASHSGASDK
eukprot:9688846-Ditylum_brightwellii.AAC.1